MKRLLAMFLALIMVLALGACAPKDDATEVPSNAADPETGETPEAQGGEAAEFDPADVTLTFASLLLNHPVLRIVELGFVEACEELGYQYQIVGTETADLNDMNAAAEAAAAAGSEAVLIWAQDSSCLSTVKALKNDYGCVVGVPHTVWEQTDIPELDFNLACVSTTYGAQCADFMAERLEGKTGSIAITQASYNITEDAAAAAFKERIEELQAEGKMEGITVLDPVLEGGSDLTESTNANVSVIQANPDLIAAFGLTGNSPVTWTNAAKKCGYEVGELLIVGMDYTAENLECLEEGWVTGIVGQPLYAEAYEAVYKMDAILRGEAVDYWTELEAPMIYTGGEGVHDPATYAGILDRVSEKFGE